MKIKGRTVWLIPCTAVVILFLIAAYYLISRRAIGDYSDPAGPHYEGSYASGTKSFDGSLRVVSWNMHYAEEIDVAIETLEKVPELRDAHILLLQEIDATGVETIAQRLSYNYVFYPANTNRRRQKEYGNAILAKWPLKNPTKIVLQNFIPGWLESRNSARAIIPLGVKDVLVYNIHLDTTWMILKRRESQAEFLEREASGKDHLIILGGDFNTWNPGSIVELEERMGNIGLARLTKGTGYTFQVAGLELTLDHIFSNAQLDYQAGVYRQTDASDHFPVWTEMMIAGDE